MVDNNCTEYLVPIYDYSIVARDLHHVWDLDDGSRSSGVTLAGRGSNLPAIARAQRLLWASTGTKDPSASDVLYVKALAAPFTVNTVPEGTLKAFDDHGETGETLPPDGGDCESVLASFTKAGIDIDALATRLQEEGASSFAKSWNDLMSRIDAKRTAIQPGRRR